MRAGTRACRRGGVQAWQAWQAGLCVCVRACVRAHVHACVRAFFMHVHVCMYARVHIKCPIVT